MNELFVPYKESLELKELGFTNPCLGYWRNENVKCPLTIGQYTTKQDMDYEISGQDELHNYKNIIALAPTFSQAFKWFRNKYEIYHHINPLTLQSEKTVRFNCEIKQIGSLYALGTFSSFEEAELECLRKLIEIVKEQKK